MTSCIGFLISMFGTRMCGQTLLFIVIAHCAIEVPSHCTTTTSTVTTQPRVGSGVVRIDLLRFLAGCHTRRLNHALSVLSQPRFLLSMYVVLLTRDSFCVVLLCVFCLLFVLVRLSVPVQVIDWKDS